MALKIHLEKQIEEQRQLIAELRSQIATQKHQYEAKIESIIHQKDEEAYQAWLGANKSYLDKYMVEYLQAHLSIDIDCRPGGYVEAQLLHDDMPIASADSQVEIAHCGYDE